MTTIPTAKKPHASVIEEMLTELQAIQGENRLQRHLLRMELRDRFDAIERKHAEVHAAVRKAGEHSVAALRKSIDELREAFTQIRHEAAAPPPAPGKPAEPVGEQEHAPRDPEC